MKNALIIVGLVALLLFGGWVAAQRTEETNVEASLKPTDDPLVPKNETTFPHGMAYGHLKDNGVGHSLGWNPGGKDTYLIKESRIIDVKAVVMITVHSTKKPFDEDACYVAELVPGKGFRVHCEDSEEGDILNYIAVIPFDGAE